MIILSFYKLFGFPTGVGALIVKNHFLKNISRPSLAYFGGGTVQGVTADGWFKFKQNDNLYESFEYGTIPFLEIMAIKFGFVYIETSFMDSLNGL